MTRARDLGDFIADGGAPELVVDTTTLVVDSTNNRVGIGTASPSQALDVTGAAVFSSTVTANAGVIVDNITIDGTEIDLSSGDLTLDVAGDIILDADGGDVKISDGGTHVGSLRNVSSDFVIQSIISDQNIIFKGNDGGSVFNALSLDMSEAGAAAFAAGATFEGDVTLPDKIVHTGDTNTAIRFPAADTISFETAGSERLRVGSAGQVGIAGANYGTAGQVLTSGGSGSAISWADASGGGSAEFTAGEAITAGDPVSLNSSGQLVKVSGAVQGTTLPDSSSTLEVRSGGSFETASGADLLLIPNTSKVIWIYNYNSDVKAQILSVNGTTISKVGSEISVSSRNGKHIYATWGPSSGDKFAIVYRDSSDGDDGFVALCSYNSATDAVTIESETNISTEFSTNRSEGTCVVFDESASAFLFAFKDGLVSSRGYVGVATLSGTTWTFGSKVTFNTSGVGDEISLVYDASLSLSMLVYLDGGLFYAHRVTVSGTTPTVSTEVTNNDITWNEDVASSRRLAGDGAGRFIACYDSSSNTRYILIKAASNSTTIADQTELTWYDGSNSKKADYVSVAFVPFATPSSGSITGRWVSLGYHQSNTTSSFGFAEEAGTNNITRGGLKEVENSSGNHLHGNLGLVYVPAQGTIVGVGAAEGSTSFAFGAKLAADSSTATEFVGLAEAGIASGASGNVTVTGGINTAQSGLTAGTFYYLTAGGGLSTSSTSFPLGIAKSSTNLVVGGNAADFNGPADSGFKFISEIVSTDSSTIDFSNVFTTTYDVYKITATNVGSNTSNIDLKAKLETASGFANYNYYLRLTPNSTSVWSYGGSTIFTTNQNNTGSDAQRCNFTVEIYNPLSTNAKHAIFNGSGYSGYSNVVLNKIDAVLQSYETADQTGIQFFASSGTITGTFRLYGLSKT